MTSHSPEARAPSRELSANGADGAVATAAEAIRDLIRRRELLPGEPVRQQEMAERLEVSRVPIREALNSLEKEGLLKHQRNRGYFVAKLSADQLAQIYQMRQLLETAMFDDYVWPDECQLDMIVAINGELANAAELGEPGKVAVLNREFHDAIFSMSRSDLIHREVSRLWEMSDSYRAFFLAGPSRHLTASEHDGIIDALRQRDRDLLVERLDHHRGRALNEVGAMIGHG